WMEQDPLSLYTVQRLVLPGIDSSIASLVLRIIQPIRYEVSLSNDPLGLCDLLAPRPGYTPTTNGCGSAGSEWVPESFYGFVDFSQCCDNHDRCYGSCAQGNSKDRCDRRLRDCMIHACDEVFHGGGFNEAASFCHDQANIYYATLWAFGGGAWEDAQSAACVCCDDCDAPSPPCP